MAEEIWTTIAPGTPRPSSSGPQSDGEEWKTISTPDATPPMSQAEALLHGYRKGASANFSDEIYGLSKASGLPDWLGGFRAPVGAARMLYNTATSDTNSPFYKQYETAVAQRRGEEKAAGQQYPGTVLAGEVAGSLLTPGSASVKAATLPARMKQGAAIGAGYGALSGFGEGENDVDRLKQAGMGGVLGGVTGGAAPAVVETALTAGGTIAAPIISAVRGAYNPQGEASRLVGRTIGADMRADPTARTRLTPQEFSANVSQGGPAAVIDLGGEGTRGLARAASNTSPEARQILDATIDPRFETQSTRVTDWLRQRFNYPNAYQQGQALDQAAKAANNPLYRRAYQAGAGNVGSPELERLASSDAVAAAMRKAAANAKDEAVLSGYGAMNPRVTFTPDGQVKFQKSPSGMPLFPDLQFWDLTRRELSAAKRVAERQGNDTEARRLGGFAQKMNTELDQVVPEYGKARQSAAGFFGAENAMEAGKDFFGQAKRFGTDETAAALAQMSPTDRKLFQDAYVSKQIDALRGVSDRRNIVQHIGGSPSAEAELNLALGQQGADALRGVRRTESIMDRARTATQGNSTTARQLAERGLYTTAGGIGAYGAYNQDPHQMTIAGIAAALTAGGRHVNQNVMRHAAEILASQNPTQIGRSAIPSTALQNPAVMSAATNRALTEAQTRTLASEQRSALARRLLERSAIGAARPSNFMRSN